MEIIEEIEFPSTNKDWGQKVLIGGILNMIPIINLLSSGYSMKGMKEAIENKSEMPQWGTGATFFSGD